MKASEVPGDTQAIVVDTIGDVIEHDPLYLNFEALGEPQFACLLLHMTCSCCAGTIMQLVMADALKISASNHNASLDSQLPIQLCKAQQRVFNIIMTAWLQCNGGQIKESKLPAASGSF